MELKYWLANYKDVNEYGWSMNVELLDGPHSDAKGVREAKHIIQGIGLDRGKDRNYVMVTIQDIPEGKIDVNEEAIAQNKKVVDWANNQNRGESGVYGRPNWVDEI